jgi:ABC-type branched-subunit amino acid transport system substrate-binding protein
MTSKTTKIIIATVAVLIVGVGAFLMLGNKQKVEKVAVPGVTDTEILVGSSAALSKPANGTDSSFLGTQTIHGSQAYINDINEKGGINGRKIKLISYDDQYDPAQTVGNTQKLITQDGVFTLFDYVGTPTSVKAIDLVNSAKVPLLGLFTGAEALRSPFQPYIFNVRDSYYNETEDAVAYFVDKLGFKKIAVMYQQDAFGETVLAGTQIALKKRGMEPVAIDSFIRGTLNVEKALDTIKDSEAEAVIMVGTYSPLAKFVKISNDAGFKPYFHTVSFVGSEAYAKELTQTWKVDPSQYNKIIVTQVVPSPSSEEFATVKEYQTLIKKYYPQDTFNYTALEGFVNAKVLVKALELAGKDLTRESFITALESMQNVDIGIGKMVNFSSTQHGGLRGIFFSKLSPEGNFTIFNQ